MLTLAVAGWGDCLVLTLFFRRLPLPTPLILLQFTFITFTMNKKFKMKTKIVLSNHAYCRGTR